MNFKKVLICVLMVMLAVSLAGCIDSQKNDNSSDKTVAEFNYSVGNDIFYRAVDQVYGEVGYNTEFGSSTNRPAADMPYYIYTVNVKTKHDGMTRQFTVWIVEDYTLVRAYEKSAKNTCYLSQEDYLYDYADWKEGKIPTKPDIKNYPDYTDAVNGNKTYDQIDKEFYGN
jgi:hypothetical protein